MTLGQAKQIVRFLLDGELFSRYEDKLNSYFDMGQKRIAATTEFIEKIKDMTVSEPIELDLEQMDERFYRLTKVEGGNWDKLTQTRIRLYAGEYRLFYNVFPTAITDHTDNDYAFELSEIAQTALPYYVAAQVTIAEHDLRFHQVYSDEFANILENVDAVRRETTARIVPMGGMLG